MILCGGAGTRLWPVSRQRFPKQLLALTGEGSLLQRTAKRLSGEGFAPALVVSGEEQRRFVARQLAKAGAPVEAILLEPTGRNTAAAAALAAAWLQRNGDGDEILLLTPSDHVIGDFESFMKAINIGLPHAEAGAIVTFGARPTGPNTQYGYIEADIRQSTPDEAFPIERFHEKPDAAKAAEYIASGGFFWNAGIFLVKASTLVNEMQQFLPASLEAISRSIAGTVTDGLFVRPAPDQFEQAENISIDHAIMEKTARGMVVPVEMGWSDIGSWDAVWELGSRDADNNVTHGDVVTFDTSNSLLRSDGPLVATIGLDKVVVVAVGDAVLVAPMDRIADLKALVEQVKARHRDRVTTPPPNVERNED